MLKFALNNGIIDIAYIQEQVNMKEREDILKNHPYSIWKGKDEKWRTYLPDDKKGRKLVKKSSRKSIEDTIIEYAKKDKIEQQETFKDRYFKWRNVQDKLVGDNSITKYNSDYERYFKGTEFERMSISCITEETIKVFLCETIKSQKLCMSATKTLFNYVKNTIRSACINKVIDEDPMIYLSVKQFYTYSDCKEKPIEKQILSKNETNKIIEMIKQTNMNTPDYIPIYAVELALYTGMRVGELSALEWSDITSDYIIIRKSEKYNRKNHEYSVEDTKNHKHRIFPITKEIKSLLDRLKKIEIQYGYICNWIFADKNGRIHAPVISSCIQRKCRQIGIEQKSIYSCRKTLNSKMKNNGVSTTVASSLLGHTETVNDKYYTFDITSIEEKRNIIEKIEAM